MRESSHNWLTGQDGSFLAESLLRKGYEVYGLVRRLSVPMWTAWGPSSTSSSSGDLMDQSPLNVAVKRADPGEVHNLRGDASKAKRVLGWEATTKFRDLVKLMVETAMRQLESVAD